MTGLSTKRPSDLLKFPGQVRGGTKVEMRTRLVPEPVPTATARGPAVGPVT